MARKPSDTVQLKLRFSERLRRRLVREAKKNGVSLNTEIVNTLERAFHQSDDLIKARAQMFAEALGDDIADGIAKYVANKRAATEQEIAEFAFKKTEEDQS
jgi:hypothetical protein